MKRSPHLHIGLSSVPTQASGSRGWGFGQLSNQKLPLPLTTHTKMSKLCTRRSGGISEQPEASTAPGHTPRGVNNAPGGLEGSVSSQKLPLSLATHAEPGVNRAP